MPLQWILPHQIPGRYFLPTIIKNKFRFFFLFNGNAVSILVSRCLIGCTTQVYAIFLHNVGLFFRNNFLRYFFVITYCNKQVSCWYYLLKPILRNYLMDKNKSIRVHFSKILQFSIHLNKIKDIQIFIQAIPKQIITKSDYICIHKLITQQKY